MFIKKKAYLCVKYTGNFQTSNPNKVQPHNLQAPNAVFIWDVLHLHNIMEKIICQSFFLVM